MPLLFDSVKGHNRRVARRAAALVGSENWIKRRVESIDLQDEDIATRSLTVDFVVPRVRGNTPLDYLPLLLLRKVPPVANLDLRDSAGGALPVLTKAENADISAEALYGALRHAVGREAVRSRDDCYAIARSSPAQAHLVVRALIRRHAGVDVPATERDYRRRLRFIRVVRTARALADNSVLWLPNTAAPGTRHVIKFSYEEQIEVLSTLPVRIGVFLGMRSLEVGFGTPHLRGCQSYHFEVTVPAGLILHSERLDAQISETERPYATREPVLLKSFGSRLHLYLNLTGAFPVRTSGDITFKVRTARRGLLSFALTAILLITAMLWSGVALRDQLDTAAASQAVPPVLLLVPAVLLILVLRPEEHPFSAFLLTGTRYLVLACGAIATASAAALGFVSGPSQSDALRITWLSAAGSTSVIAVLVLAGWIAAFPSRLRAVAWGAIASVAVLVTAGWATIADRWSSWALHGVLVAAGVAVACLGLGVRRRPVPPVYQRYFSSDIAEGSAMNQPDE